MEKENLQKGIFSGLEKFGLTEVINKKITIYEHEPSKPRKKKAEPTAPAEEIEIDIDDYVYPKSFVCPVCSQDFKSYVLRHGRVRLQNIEFDLRPVYTPIEPIFYDIVMCVCCGFTAVQDKFDQIPEREAQRVLKELAPQFRPQQYPKELTIDMAIERYQLALLNAVIRKAKEGEKAYICMKLTWLHRIKGDSLEMEKKFASLTTRGFISALRKENPPIMKMEESTVLYLLGAFSFFLGDNTNALKLVSSVITSQKPSNRLKDRARELKDMIKTPIV